ncbi:lipase secretion chaperone [Marinobacter lacisalsi]|uniref:Lipase chaperone n=1 Tax=Marinobacter lacisalsi TaxID=475979 RepID=A0ABV8QKD1_9GAMM
MAGNRDGWWLAAVISPLVLLGGWMLWPDSPEPAPSWASSDDSGRPTQTIASQWQEPDTNLASPQGTGVADSQPSADDAEAPDAEISLDRLQHALANIGIDENGDLVLDEIALASLRQAFRGLENAGPETLNELKLYVEAGLAGETGSQAARILGDYINYRKALAAAEADWGKLDDLGPRQKLERAIDLRRQHMDPLAASQLFAGEDAHQRYLIAMEEVRADPDLTGEQRQQALTRLREDLHSGALLVDGKGTDAVEKLRSERQKWESMGLSDETQDYLKQQTLGLVAARDLAGTDTQDWQNRYDQFSQQRNTILNAGLTEDEKARQVESLMATYFTEEEVEAASNWLPEYLKTELSD